MRTLAILLLAGCSGATASRSDNVLLETVADKEGNTVGAFEVVATLGPLARQMDVDIELRCKGGYVDSSNIVLTGLQGVVEVGSISARDLAQFTFSPDTATCEGPGFELTEDDECVVTVVGLAVMEDIISPIGSATVQVFAPENWAGDANALLVELTVDNAPVE